jgi:hypothetical protein
VVRLGVLIFVVAIGACSHEPSCREVAAHVSELAAREDAAMRAASSRIAGSAQSTFMPSLEAFGAEIAATCEQGKLSSEARRCFMTAERGSDLDRCAHRNGL